jgi:hypothetical protein
MSYCTNNLGNNYSYESVSNFLGVFYFKVYNVENATATTNVLFDDCRTIRPCNRAHLRNDLCGARRRPCQSPHHHAQRTRDPPRAYYGSVVLAILAIGACSVSADGSDADVSVWPVRVRHITVAECPAPLHPLMRELVAIGMEAERTEEEDTEAAIVLAQQGRVVPVLRLEHVRVLLERGRDDVRVGKGYVGWTEEHGGTSGRVCESG